MSAHLSALYSLVIYIKFSENKQSTQRKCLHILRKFRGNYNLLIECCPETPPAPPPDIPASNLTPATGQGDPHIETFQGAHYTVANVGTFLAFNFSKKMLSLKVQFVERKRTVQKQEFISVRTHVFSLFCF